jgi:hypothetical protein
MTPSIFRLTAAPTNSDTTADAITSALDVGIASADDVTALAWTTIAFPTATTDTLDSYLTVDDIVSELGLFSVDLTDFLVDCNIVDSCQYYSYLNRYDGLALGHWVDFALLGTAEITYDDTYTHAVGEDVANLPVSVGLCDADTFICWGWTLEGTYTTALTATGNTSGVTYVATFSSGVSYQAFATAVPTAANVLTLFSSDLLDVSPGSSTTGYGFSDVYWYT